MGTEGRVRCARGLLRRLNPARRNGPRRGVDRLHGRPDMTTEIEIDTTAGRARVTLDAPRPARALLLLGHGAGGGIDARDLRAVRDGATTAGYAVARLTQPYRMASGRRPPAPAPVLDTVLAEVVRALRRRRALAKLPLVVGGRSSGARVGCRCAATVGAAGVLALGFPLHPPGRPDRSRAAELQGVEVPVLVVQGQRDPFGSPDELFAAGLPTQGRVHVVPGADHGMAVRKGDPRPMPAIVAAVIEWLDTVIGGP